MQNAKKSLVGLLAVAAMYSCVPTRTPKTETIPVPDRYQDQPADTINTATIKWREFFSDPNLITLIDTALVRNQELNILLKQVDIAKNEIGARKGEYLPFLGVQAGAGVDKVGRYTSQGANDANTDIRPG